MPQMDGSIRVGTKIETKEAERELKSLESSIQKTADKIASLRSKMDELKDAKLPTKEYDDLGKEYQKLEIQLQRLSEKQNKFLEGGGKRKSNTFKNLDYEINNVIERQDYVLAKMREMEASGKDFTLGANTDEYAQMAAQVEQLTGQMQADQQRSAEIQSALTAEEERLTQIKANATVSDQKILDLLERKKQLTQEITDMERSGVGLGYKEYDLAQQELSSINNQLKEYKANLDNIPKRFSKVKDFVANAFEALSGGVKKGNALLDAAFTNIRKSAKKTFDTITNGANKSNVSLSGGFKTILKYGFGIRSLYVLFNKIRSGIKEGFSHFMDYSSDFANSVQSMKNAMSTLGNQFAAAFAPIVQVVIPWLVKLINTISEAITYIAQFFAILGGKSTFTRAKQVQDEYNKSLGGTASAAKKAYGALAKFDDLDVLQKQDDAGGAGGATDAAEDLFEEVPFENEALGIIEKIKNALSQLFAPFKAAWDEEGKLVIDSWKYALEEIWQLMKDIGRDFLIVWNQEATIQMFSDILHIIGDIGLVMGNITHALNKAWNTNQVGLRILENIRDIFAVIVHNIREAADYTVTWSKDLDFYPLLESFAGLTASLIPLADNLSSALMSFYKNVLLPIAKWAIEDALPASIDVLSAAIDALNAVIEALKPLGVWLWENFLQPIGQWAGEVIIAALEIVTDLLTKFADWISEHQEAVQNFAIILGSFALAWGIVSTALTVASGVMAIASAASTALGAAIAFLTSPIGIIIVAIGALIAIGVALYKNWDTIKEKIGELKEWFVQKWEEIKEWFAGIPDKIGEIINAIVEWFEGLPGRIGYAIGFVIGKIIEWAIEARSTFEEKVAEIIDSVVEWFKELPSKIYDAILSIGEKIPEWKDNVISFFSENVPVIIENVVNFFDELPGKLIDVGTRAIEGIWQGIQDAKDWLTGKIKDFCGGFVDGFKDALGIHSPSAVMAEQGEYITEGLLNGIAEKIHLVSDLWASLKDDMVSVLESMGTYFTGFWENLFVGVSESLQNIQIFFFETWQNIALTMTETQQQIQLTFDEFLLFLTDVFMLTWQETWEEAGSMFQVFQELIAELSTAIQNLLTTFMQFVKLLVDNQWKSAWETAKSAFMGFKGSVENIINDLRKTIQAFYDWVMALVAEMKAALSSVGGSAGGSLSGSGASAYNIAGSVAVPVPVSFKDLPHLASGSVIRGGNPFAAILGDQPRGQTNIEAPLSTIEQAVDNVMNRRSSYGGGLNPTISLNVNGEEFARLTLGDILSEMSRQGYDVDVLGVT